MVDDDEERTHENNDTLHITFPCLDLDFVMTLGLLHVNGRERVRPLVVLSATATGFINVRGPDILWACGRHRPLVWVWHIRRKHR